MIKDADIEPYHVEISYLEIEEAERREHRPGAAFKHAVAFIAECIRAFRRGSYRNDNLVVLYREDYQRLLRSVSLRVRAEDLPVCPLHGRMTHVKSEYVCRDCGDPLGSSVDLSSHLQRRLAEWLEHLASVQRNLPIDLTEGERRDLCLAAMMLRDQHARAERAEAEVYVSRKHAADLQLAWDVSEKYFELLFAVAKKHQGETRHETALRYIRQAELNTGGPVKG